MKNIMVYSRKLSDDEIKDKNINVGEENYQVYEIKVDGQEIIVISDYMSKDEFEEKKQNVQGKIDEVNKKISEKQKDLENINNKLRNLMEELVKDDYTKEITENIEKMNNVLELQKQIEKIKNQKKGYEEYYNTLNNKISRKREFEKRILIPDEDYEIDIKYDEDRVNYLSITKENERILLQENFYNHIINKKDKSINVTIQKNNKRKKSRMTRNQEMNMKKLLPDNITYTYKTSTKSSIKKVIAGFNDEENLKNNNPSTIIVSNYEIEGNDWKKIEEEKLGLKNDIQGKNVKKANNFEKTIMEYNKNGINIIPEKKDRQFFLKTKNIELENILEKNILIAVIEARKLDKIKSSEKFPIR